MARERFLEILSHELRTPLAALKARVELGLRDQDPRIWHSTLEDAALNADRLTHLANQLLSLARIESGARAIAEMQAAGVVLIGGEAVLSRAVGALALC